MTRGDRIRQMSNEELARWLEAKLGFDTCLICTYEKYSCEQNCEEGIKAYLDMEVE